MFEEPKDIFAGTDAPIAEGGVPAQAMSAAPVQPPSAPTIVPPPTSLPPSYGAQLPAGEPPRQHKGGSGMKVGIIVFVVVLIVGMSGYFAWKIMVQPASNGGVVDAVSDGGVQDALTPDEDEDVEDDVVPVEAPKQQSNPATLLDSDGDGLTNARELEVGTSVTKSDTDGDGLGDREEVEVYGTDPRNPDTDGDGFLDGQEVSSGYNPNGEGKLFGVPSGS